MNHPNLKELATRIHENNKAAGWWDIPRPRVQTAWLVVTELAEATEAERAGKYADLEAFEAQLVDNEKVIDLSIEFAGSPTSENIEKHRLSMWAGSFKRHIKDTFEDEIADAVIRLLDFAASEGKAGAVKYDPYWPVVFTNEECFVSVARNIHGLIEATAIHNELAMGYFNQSFSQLVKLSEHRGFDLWQHVELKLKYNATRGQMHGGKKF